ncbi:MAG: CBS domain-containing protein, partial [Thermoplasmata archaeon]
MNPSPTIIRTYTGVSETAALFIRKNTNQFPILDSSDHLAGLLMDLDLLNALNENHRRNRF